MGDSLHLVYAEHLMFTCVFAEHPVYAEHLVFVLYQVCAEHTVSRDVMFTEHVVFAEHLMLAVYQVCAEHPVCADSGRPALGRGLETRVVLTTLQPTQSGPFSQVLR